MKHTIKILFLTIMPLFLQMCSPTLPKEASTINKSAKIEPDYTNLTIPVNIAPLNFNINEKGEKFVTRFYDSNGHELIVGGRTLDINEDKWHELLKSAQGGTLSADIYAKREGRWYKFSPINYLVAEEIDPYISYRYIEPLYLNYKVLNICQRNLENFEEKDIYNNSAFLDVEGDRQCINCHSYQDYNREGKMQMHVRVKHPGTLIVQDGKIEKVNLKVGDIFTAGAYPSWHPSMPIIAYSINDTWQHFHSVNSNKVEVQDAKSGLILYEIDNNTVRIIDDSPTELETFPYWSPDGNTLYYVSANIPLMTPEEMANYRIDNYKDIKYNLYKRAFDKDSRTFGPIDTVYNAAALGKSATFPRESPDGRFLLFTVGEYGTFHAFHHDADLYIMDLATGESKPLDTVNSDDTDSYHSWSSNGRWVIFTSRRDNGSFTRLYLTHFDENGNASKPFIVPQKSPFANDLLFKSFNVPEFMVKPVEVTRSQWIEAVESDPKDANFKK